MLYHSLMIVHPSMGCSDSYLSAAAVFTESVSLVGYMSGTDEWQLSIV